MSVIVVRQRDWWLIALRGIAAVLFGIAAFVWPGLTLEILVLLWGAFVLVDGVVSTAEALRSRRRADRGWQLVEGVAGIVVGLIALIFPGVAALALLALIAVWAILTGIAEIFLAVRLRERLRAEWLLAAAGVISILFGIAVVAFPAAGALAVVWLIGAYALVSGVLLIALGLTLRERRGLAVSP